MRIRSAAAVFIVAFAAVACAPVPIMNVDEAPVVTASGKALSKSDVRAAILRAGSGLGWIMKDEDPNTLVGTLNLRTHSAVVEIPYSQRAYSIKYRSSVDLDAADGKIHKNYNGWIQNLQRSINANLASAS